MDAEVKILLELSQLHLENEACGDSNTFLEKKLSSSLFQQYQAFNVSHTKLKEGTELEL